MSGPGRSKRKLPPSPPTPKATPAKKKIGKKAKATEKQGPLDDAVMNEPTNSTGRAQASSTAAAEPSAVPDDQDWETDASGDESEPEETTQGKKNPAKKRKTVGVKQIGWNANTVAMIITASASRAKEKTEFERVRLAVILEAKALEESKQRTVDRMFKWSERLENLVKDVELSKRGDFYAAAFKTIDKFVVDDNLKLQEQITAYARLQVDMKQLELQVINLKKQVEDEKEKNKDKSVEERFNTLFDAV